MEIKSNQIIGPFLIKRKYQMKRKLKREKQ